MSKLSTPPLQLTQTSKKPRRNGWTPERRARQSQAIHQWQPWQHSTGASTQAGKAKVSRNAFKGGFAAQLRALSKETNAMLREHRSLIERINDK